MINYSLEIKVERGVFRQLLPQGQKLCLAFGVEDEGYNVIALNSNISPSFYFQWNDSFRIGASNQNFQNGFQVQSSTDVNYIKCGQIYTLTPDWQGSVNDGGSEGAIVFDNRNDKVSPILFKTINGSFAPIYFSSHMLPGGNTREIKPNNRVAVWLQSDGRGDIMIDGIQDKNPFEIDMSRKTNASVVLNDDFTWSLQ